MRTLSMFVICVLSAQSVSAEEYETTLLFEQGAWVVEHVYDTNDDSAGCIASTANDRGQELGAIVSENGRMIFGVYDPIWSLSEREVQFRIDVDYDRWDVWGTASQDRVLVTPNNAEEALDFLADLAKGSAVALYNERGVELGNFSLHGSEAAIRSFLECFQRISKQESASTDPFGPTEASSTGGKDPF